MTRVDEKRETCPCQVCRSDLAYILPCVVMDSDPGRVSFSVERERPTVVEIFPIPLMM